MIIYPAIDLRRGRCVRLRQGDPAAETVFGDNPAATAQNWAAQGAEWLHIVNLDGALGATRAQLQALHRPPNILVQHPGSSSPTTPDRELSESLPLNLVRLREIRQAVDVPIQFGGGLRTLEDIRLALELGADRVVLGTVAVEQPNIVSDSVEIWGAERIVVGIDARAGKVATHGWQHTSRIEATELGHRVHALGIRRVVYTDISRDGMLSGVNVEATARLGDVTGLKVIASGGVAGIGDIELLKTHEHFNIDGVVVGQAIYEGKLELKHAICIGHRPLQSHSAGIVPFRWTDSGPEFLILFNFFCEHWQFPRGVIHENESERDCALRRFWEETALPIRHFYEESRLDLHYTAKIRDYSMDRTVTYFLAEAGDQHVHLDSEHHCEARWLSADEAWSLLTETSPEQLPALDAALAFLKELRPAQE